MIIVGDDVTIMMIYVCVYVYMYVCMYVHKFLTTKLVIFSVYYLLYVLPLTTGSGDWNGHSYLP